MWAYLLPEVFRKTLISEKAICLNKKYNKVIKTFLSSEPLKELQNKSTTSTAEDTATKQVDSKTLTPVDEDANAIYINKLGLLGREDLLSKTTTLAKETFDQATSPIEVVSTRVPQFDLI
ncbi:ATP dependent DNA helicase [Gigaspora margarita]|uniref:ATP dependent DNA helicase n=1 Tax=Gigaspora margarita TaxID=4874 RepID=A0A8H3XGC3_GIGMA|nr:ATP dependent DNA helicase [Gigaspora margarita]